MSDTFFFNDNTLQFCLLWEIFFWLIGMRYLENKFGEPQYCNSGKKIFLSCVSSLILSSCYQLVCLSWESQLWHEIICLHQLFLTNLLYMDHKTKYTIKATCNLNLSPHLAIALLLGDSTYVFSKHIDLCFLFWNYKN